MVKLINEARRWQYIPLIPVLNSQRQVDLSDSEATLVDRASSRKARDTQRNREEKQRGKRRGRELTKTVKIIFRTVMSIFTKMIHECHIITK